MILPVWVKPAALALVLVGAFSAGYRISNWKHDSEELVAAKAAQEAAQAVSGAAVTAIQGIKVKYITVQQHAETITRENVIYKECTHVPEMMQTLNSALEGSHGN